MFLHNKVTLIGTPDYGVKGCEPGYYNSVFVVREENRNKSVEEFNEANLAVNDYFSQSGWAAPQNYMKTSPESCRLGCGLAAKSEKRRSWSVGLQCPCNLLVISAMSLTEFFVAAEGGFA